MKDKFSNVVEWVDYCTEYLAQKHNSDFDSTLLIYSFVTQYEIGAKYLLSNLNSKSLISRLKELVMDAMHLHKSLQHQPKLELQYEGRASELDVFFWPFQKMHIEVMTDVFLSLRTSNEQIKVSIGTHNPPIQQILQIEKLPHLLLFKNATFPVFRYQKDKTCQKVLASAIKLPGYTSGNKVIHFADVLKRSWHLWLGLYKYTVQCFETVVTELKPKGIFIGNDITLAGSAISRLAKHNGIKTFCLMHGSIKNPLWKYSSSDCFFTFGEKDKEVMVRRGKPVENMVVSGSPKLEKITRDRASFDDMSEKVILVALSGPGHSVSVEHHLEILNCLEILAKTFTNHPFVFKLHKKDRDSHYKNIAALENCSLVKYGDLSQEQSIYYWLNKSKALITGGSTTAIEAMYFKIPVLTLDIQSELKEIDFIKHEVVLHATNQPELQENIIHVLNKDSTYKRHMDRALGFAEQSYATVPGGTINLIKQTILTRLSA